MLSAVTYLTCFSAVLYGSNALQLPQDHILWGVGGQPTTLERRGANPTSSTAPASSSLVADSSCTNGPLTRTCWKNGYSVSDDFDKKWPTTGVTRSYNFEITNTTCAPDGIRKECLLVNGQYPGPTIYADWGDMVSVTVKNSLQHNGSSIHFHGVRQQYTNVQDGTNGLTECPLPPGHSKTYTFQATQFGTSWYHSHYSVQYGEGVLGPIVFNGPATSNYDIDLGPYPVTDWLSNLTSYQYLDVANATQQLGQAPPPLDNILINGTNKNANGGGSYSVVTLTANKKHRVRLINTSTESQLRVTLDGHNFTVIANDFVPIKPFSTNQLLMGIGQRYDVIVTANQAPGNYWFRVNAAQECASSDKHNGLAIFNYQGVAVVNATTTSVALAKTCNEPSSLTPWWSITIPSSDFQSQAETLAVDLAVPSVTSNGQNVVAWIVNLESIDIAWDHPTLQYVANNDTNYPKTYNLIEIPNQGMWVYWILQEPADTVVKIPHPMHLHGHDFWVLGRGNGTFNSTSDFSSLNFNNPTRRDTTLLPAGGWVVIAWFTDNPGAWLFHCHIGTHISTGLGVQVLESKDKIGLPDSAWQDNCNNWEAYYSSLGPNSEYLQNDSGL